ncbi:MAG: VOC family protein [Planctomycetes bacterium]|nr:VOC family protein [Planctomycetota bacterium]MBI3845439.1 VOC family protein [Planctomycetota bacterium]
MYDRGSNRASGAWSIDESKHLGIRHVALRVRDLARAEAFYVGVLGFRVEWRPDPKNVYLTSGADNLALHEADGALDPPERSRLDHFGLLVRKPEDVDRFAAFVKSRGVALRAEPKTHRDGARSFYLDDPDGNSIQVIHHPPISETR